MSLLSFHPCSTPPSHTPLIHYFWSHPTERGEEMQIRPSAAPNKYNFRSLTNTMSALRTNTGDTSNTNTEQIMSKPGFIRIVLIPVALPPSSPLHSTALKDKTFKFRVDFYSGFQFKLSMFLVGFPSCPICTHLSFQVTVHMFSMMLSSM